MPTPSPTSAAGRRPNRRGETTRTHVLKVALQVLSSGRPDAVSVNLVARQAGVTWGTVQYQFGDADGLWAATLDHILATAGPTVWARPTAAAVPDRVAELIELVWAALGSNYYTARTNLQSNLAATRAELEAEYPRTATALDAVDEKLADQFEYFLSDLPVSPLAIQRVCAFVPTALRGLHAEHTFGFPIDVEAALVGLRDAVIAYLVPTATGPAEPQPVVVERDH
ncbi:TetR/AcrR family transcriptional regulator [Mycobacterium sp. TNTM28]|uniref:TetR/AcrR family transcriptional regulator n=1 Tax=[Mycobacterium] fortunisiensis TaxID=2600579 RepID=A0ABS6KHV8_9MYCO|nr:TetR/AcrR family transcriptional regulator [[Mycobacterium] fortunisiensis]MBU9763171.1 TetR/AcrR family transcriptional regulator [[Mycobacterium] fortunisiensis]